MVKYNSVHFYSEGPPNDNAKDLSYCKEILLEKENKCFNNVAFYTPKILENLGYNKFLKEYAVTELTRYYESMCK